MEKDEIRLNLGSGDSKFGGFISVDKYDETADVRADICELPYKDNTVSEIRAYQVIEHIPYNKTEDMFKEMYRVLKPGGTAHLECPDAVWVAEHIIANDGDFEDIHIKHLFGEYHRPWDIGRYGPEAVEHPGSKHFTMFTFKRLKKIVEPIGFKIKETTEKHLDVPENLSVILCKPAS